MHNIVELKIEETKAVVGGVKAATVAATAKQTALIVSESKSASVAATADRFSM
jgi:hypothetical protein